MRQHPANDLSPQDRTVSATLRLLDEAARWLGIRIPQPEIRFDIRGQSAGQVRLGRSGRCVIRYNPALLAWNPELFVAETVAHEVAHLIAFARHGRGIRPHGPEWQAIMRHLGAEPSRCHSYDLSLVQSRMLKRFPYYCRCGEHHLTSIRHNRVLKGETYYCRRCNDPLRRGSPPAIGGG